MHRGNLRGVTCETTVKEWGKGKDRVVIAELDWRKRGSGKKPRKYTDTTLQLNPDYLEGSSKHKRIHTGPQFSMGSGCTSPNVKPRLYRKDAPRAAAQTNPQGTSVGVWFEVIFQSVKSKNPAHKSRGEGRQAKPLNRDIDFYPRRGTKKEVKRTRNNLLESLEGGVRHANTRTLQERIKKKEGNTGAKELDSALARGQDGKSPPKR